MRSARAPRRFAIAFAAWAMLLASLVPLLAHGAARKAQEPWAVLCGATGSTDAPDLRPAGPHCGLCSSHTSMPGLLPAPPAVLALFAFSGEAPPAPRAVAQRALSRLAAQTRGPPAAP